MTPNMLLRWVAMSLGFPGAVGTAAPWKRVRLVGFTVSLVADILWFAAAYGATDHPLMVINVLYGSACLYGVWSNRPQRG